MLLSLLLRTIAVVATVVVAADVATAVVVVVVAAAPGVADADDAIAATIIGNWLLLPLKLLDCRAEL